MEPFGQLGHELGFSGDALAPKLKISRLELLSWRHGNCIFMIAAIGLCAGWERRSRSGNAGGREFFRWTPAKPNKGGEVSRSS